MLPNHEGCQAIVYVSRADLLFCNKCALARGTMMTPFILSDDEIETCCDCGTCVGNVSS